MSIMDHDPKYRKLREWREKRELDLWHERLRNSPMRRLVPRKTYTSTPVYAWRPITAMLKEQE